VDHPQRFCNKLLGKVTRHEESSENTIFIIGNGLREFSFDSGWQTGVASRRIGSILPGKSGVAGIVSHTQRLRAA
jgi:hypothetical protein